jgi:hypothetical protein
MHLPCRHWGASATATAINMLLLLVVRKSIYSVQALAATSIVRRNNHCAVVVGKVIIDEYRSPDDDNKHPEKANDPISIGGGGPQAAWGTAAALAVLDLENEDESTTSLIILSDPPPPQPVMFFGPVGQIDWTERENQALESILGPAIESIHLNHAPSLRTPRIQLWHDEQQNIQWNALHDSLGPEGAENLWRNRPSAEDVLKELDSKDKETIDSLFLIMEVGANAPGGGDDATLLTVPTLLGRTKLIGVEPVAFTEKKTGLVSKADAQSCKSRLEKCSSAIDFVAPDHHLYKALDKDFWKSYSVAVRDGPDGSSVWEKNEEASAHVPAAKLTTLDGQPVNPTGAGNAYSAALTACLGKGSSLLEASCIATAIGATVCEYSHLPPWTWEILFRIRKGANEVRHAIASNVITVHNIP